MYEPSGVFIDNAMVPSTGTSTIDVVSPSTEEKIGQATLATKADVDRAVASARAAFDSGPWPRMSVGERREVLRRTGAILASKVDELSRLVTAENGVNIRFQQGNVADHFDYHVALPVPGPDRRDMGRAGGEGIVVQEPAGVVAAIVPWNSPVPLGLSKVLPALLAGCTVVLKPAPETPLHDFVIATAFSEAGLPPGVLNVVVADREVSEHLVRSPGVDLVSFTGSTGAGRRIGAICGEQIKRTVLELGGKSAAIVLDDMDIQRAASVLHTGMLLNNGQACMAWTRILVPRHRHDELVDAFCTTLEQVKVGDPFDPENLIGPLVAERQRDRVEGYIRSGLDEGAKVVFGGGRPKGLDRGWYVEPTLVVNADNSMKMCREEIFGPVGTVIAYDTVDEAVAIANDTNYGLAGAVFTEDVDRAVDIAGRVRAGTIGVNTLGVGRSVPFGGFKDSGIGRHHGPEGLMEYLETKTIALPRKS